METNQINSEVKKPPLFFVARIKSIASFDDLLLLNKIIPSEIKSGEIEVLLSNSDDYRNCHKLLSDFNNKSEEIKKSVGVVKYHTYRLTEDKPFRVFIRRLHHSTEINDIIAELDNAGHKAVNVINIRIKKLIDNKVSIIKLPLF